MITKRELMVRICQLEADVDFLYQELEDKKTKKKTVKKTAKRGKKSEATK